MKFFSEELNKVFDTEQELKDAEAAKAAEVAKKAELAQKKREDAKEVEDSFKALNAARREYKTNIDDWSKRYTAEIEQLRKKFTEERKKIHTKLSEAEEAYAKALKDFTSKHETYHLSLKDGDFETTISNKCSAFSFADNFDTLMDLFKFVF